MSSWVATLTIATALGSGLMAGVFFAFSTFIMQALAQLTVPQGVRAMQAINRTVLNPLFLGVFGGTAIAGVLVAIVAVPRWSDPSAGALFAGAMLYVLGTFGVTVVGNVPLNEELARVDAEGADAAGIWATYLRRWTAWNHVRTIAATAGSGALIVGFASSGL